MLRARLRKEVKTKENLINIGGVVEKKIIDYAKFIMKKLDIKKDTKLFFICKSGVRSNHAGNYINENLISENIFNVEGGMEFGWKINNLPVSV